MPPSVRGGATSAVTSIFEGDISGAFSMTFNATRTNENVLTLSGDNTFSGGLITTGAGVLNINSPTALGTGTFTHGGGGNLNNTSGSAVTLSNNNPQNWNSNFTFVGTNDLNMGTGAVTINANRTVTVSGGTLTVGGVIGQDAAGRTFTKAGAGTLVLGGASTYSGATTVQQGNLVAAANAPSGSAGAFGNATSEIVLGVAGSNNAAGVLIGDGDYTISRAIRNATSNSTDAGTRVLTLGGNSAHNSVFSGNIFLGTTNNTSKGIQLTAAVGGQVTFSGVIQNPTGQDATEATAAAALNAVTKAGAGTVILSNANTYTGATVVNEGTLLINGSTSSTSVVTVNNGGTLGGAGTVGGSVTLNDGAFLSPGASIESLATGSNTWNGGSTFVFEFSTDGSTGVAGTAWDLLSITGTLDLTGASNLNPINLNLITMQSAVASGLLASWDPDADAIWSGFVTATGGITGFAASLFDIDTTGFQNTINGTFSVAKNGDNLDLIYTAVPEPRAALLGGIGLFLLLRRRRH